MSTTKARPSLQDMVKQAMSGAAHKVAVNLEAARQLAATEDDQVKEASAPSPQTGHVATETVIKLANALGFIAEQVVKEAFELSGAESGAADGPGTGPGALTVMQAISSGSGIEAGQSGQATPGNQPPMNPSTQTEQVQVGKANTGLETNDDMKHPEQPVEPIANEKTSSGLAASNLLRMQKMAKGKDDHPGGHHIRRALLGNPVSSAIEAEKGKKLRSFGGALKHELGQSLKGTAIGGGAGAALGAGIGALKGGKSGAKAGALAGGYLGGNIGSLAGVMRGRHGAHASELHARYSKHRDKSKESSAPISLIRKLAEDAINPAQITSPASVDPVEPPEGASASEEAGPSEPSDVNSQKSMISSNEAAINYTKGQAKADPKKDLADVLTEPALSKAHDSVLQQSFDNTGAAGVKISSARGMAKTAHQVGAQRLLISRLIKQAEESKKKKTSMGMAPSTPQAATGINAASMGM